MNTWQAQGSQVVKLFAKRVWFYLIFSPILVWFSLKMRSDLGPNLEIYGLISQLGTLQTCLHMFERFWMRLNVYKHVWMRLNMFERVWTRLNAFECVWKHSSMYKYWIKKLLLQKLFSMVCYLKMSHKKRKLSCHLVTKQSFHHFKN